jgi:hypothetical protein
MLAISANIIFSVQAEASLVMDMMTKLEVKMKTTIKMMCVVAGTALLGWLADMFSMLQESARVLKRCL